jgi:hypothetical protein
VREEEKEWRNDKNAFAENITFCFGELKYFKISP